MAGLVYLQIKPELSLQCACLAWPWALSWLSWQEHVQVTADFSAGLRSETCGIGLNLPCSLESHPDGMQPQAESPARRQPEEQEKNSCLLDCCVLGWVVVQDHSAIANVALRCQSPELVFVVLVISFCVMCCFSLQNIPSRSFGETNTLLRRTAGYPTLQYWVELPNVKLPMWPRLVQAASMAPAT